MEFDLVGGLRDLGAAPDVPSDAVPLPPVLVRVRRGRALRTVAVTAGAAAVLAIGAVAYAAPWQPAPPAATPTSTATSGPEPEPVTITWWVGASPDALVGLWQTVAHEFEEAHPHVTVDLQWLNGSDPDHARPPAEPPDVFVQGGAGDLAAQVATGGLRDITDDVAAEVETIGGPVAPWMIGNRVYGLPYRFGIEGFWYNTELFEQAGIEGTPATLDELHDAIDTLKTVGITPIALGAGDGWPAAHYWYNVVLRTCSPDALARAQADLVFDDPCFVEAGELLAELIAAEPFQEDYLTTTSQVTTSSSAGLLATGQAAMELMGEWHPSVLAGNLRDITGDEDATAPEFLGWFPFPGVEGADGDPTAALGGGDGFAVSADAPDEAVDLLRYVLSEDVQRRFGESGAGLPVVPAAQDSVTDPNLQTVLEGMNDAAYVQLWLDTSYGPVVGGAMNEAIVALFTGAGTPQGIVDAMTAAAAAP